MEGRFIYMCGIVGYVGNRQASNLLVEGLSKLEYRGYDSAGIAVINNGKVEIRKHKGKSYKRSYWNWSYKMGYSW